MSFLGRYRSVLMIAGVFAALAFAARGILEGPTRTGGPYLLVAGAIVVALLLRKFVARD